MNACVACACVPLVYHENGKALCISLWYPGRVDEAKRKIIFEGLRGENKNGWINFLQCTDAIYEDDVFPLFTRPKELAGLTGEQLGVVHFERKDIFSFNNPSD